MTHRIRSKAFGCLLRQEVAYFDRPENSSGAICARLSSDATAIEEMTGTRLGAICEALSLSLFGFIFGCFISWQLAFIVCAPILFVSLLSYVEIRVNLWLNEKTGPIIEQARVVSYGFYVKMNS